jgi:hypothetical protein
MKTTVDIQLFLEKKENNLLIDKLNFILPYEFIAEDVSDKSTLLIISYRSDNELNYSLDQEIKEFLIKLLSVEKILLEFEKTLRVGVFYDIKETIVCPILLEKETIELIARFKTKIFLTGYLCSEPEPAR